MIVLQTTERYLAICRNTHGRKLEIVICSLWTSWRVCI